MEHKLSFDNEAEISSTKTFILYLVIFFVVWSFKELWLVNYINSFNEPFSSFLGAFVKVSVWIIPAWLYTKYYLNYNPINYFKMNTNVKRGLFWGVVLSMMLGLRFAIEVYILNDQTFNFNLSVGDYLNIVLLAGITEEIVFRGLILQQISKRLAFWKSNIITSLLFLTIHYPIWIYAGEFFDLWGHMYVFLLGLIFGFVYKKTGSLWSIVLLHSFHNFFVIII